MAYALWDRLLKFNPRARLWPDGDRFVHSAGQGSALPANFFWETSAMWMIYAAIGLGIALAIVALYLLTCLRVLTEYERGVVFRLGRAMPKPKGPGWIMVFWPVDTMTRIDLRTITKVIEPQDVITRDNVSVRVDAVLYYRVVDPKRAVLEVEDFMYATSQVALTTLRSTLGQAELDELLAERDKVNRRLQEIIDAHTEPWGVKVSAVEVKDVGLPDPMKRSMARQAEAERERRAKVINAEGEFQASAKLRQAAEIMTPYPLAMQMRYLQALAEVAADKNSTIIFPLPIELLRPFLEPQRNSKTAEPLANGRPEDVALRMKDSAQPAQTTGAGATPATVGEKGL
jgi:regulator of protease activity HflC (stomatin/prohibitin superfamily)